MGAAILGLRSTIRIEERHPERHRELRARGVPFAFALWHGRMVIPILAHRHEGVVTMASRSKDGEIIARWLRRNGYVAGARIDDARGRRRAHGDDPRDAERPSRGALTVDGPKGPPRVVQPGILRLVRETGAWVLPISGASSRPRFLRSWDRFLVPLPCLDQRGDLRRAVRVPASMSDEEASRRLAEALDAATREADDAVGVVPPPPWAS